MRALPKFLLSLFALAAAMGGPVAAKPHVIPAYSETQDLAAPVKAALQAKAAGRRVLMVFDIDNTLLTSAQDLGGDNWYVWKRGQDDAATGAGRKAVSDLLRDDGALLNLTLMRPTQPDMSALIGQLQAQGVDVYALSARGPELRAATERVLAQAGVDLSPAPECGPPLCVKRGKLGDKQIHAAAAKAGWPVTGPFHPVTVSDGVMLVSGQDKGLMLDLLLESLKTRYDDVWFVDDTPENVEKVRKAAPHIHARLHPYAYSRLWADAADFMRDRTRQDKAEQGLDTFRAGVCDAVRSYLCAAH